MGYTIAVAGKGGTGKTSLTGLLIDYLVKKGEKPILAVDADANSNLNEVLGEEIEFTIGEIREEVSKRENTGNSFPGGMTKAQYLKYRLNGALIEGRGYDLIVMGRSEGQGCYCYVNGMLREQIDSLSDSYKYLVIDNEAGMEHLSRKTTKHIDTLLLVSDSSKRGIQAVGRINQLVKELGLSVQNIHLIVNRVANGELKEDTKQEIEKQGLSLLGVVPLDQQVYEYDAQGIPLVNLPEDSISKTALRNILSKIQF
ncbi:CO dehydrogenase nickel-insertion accessory protein CooC [Clostridium aceticum]|uniref:CO dehydrogenase nickel-insertion accessory protein CooC n=1 Tax=Clostridium aceticum TaxID=84022 RepID=A0A0D8ID93_9CLOT|nr:carbon monoxide dehydrogenase accessory protein CooC [Clostridium aceticum]AKL94531.1 CO dehydrogenase nickel-insertion accessory protein CooC [Clostridium aceticum]KJF28263.1 carbon monoxide dehydrogenase [Clostridium aceticum]